jgi:hypothetical protein
VAYILHVNDNGPHGTALAKEARMTGWVSLSAVGGVGVGTGQFPTPAQCLTTGFVNYRKSISADAAIVPWVCYADDRTFYLFVTSGDGVLNLHYGFGFGEFYSYYPGTTDANRVGIFGRSVENSASVSGTSGGLANQTKPSMTITSCKGRYAADTAAGGAGSQQLFPNYNVGFCSGVEVTTPLYFSGGSQHCHADNSRYIQPILLLDAAWGVRAQYRGLHTMIGAYYVAEGVKIIGTGDYEGKTFDVISACDYANVILVETSDTLPTNA